MFVELLRVISYISKNGPWEPEMIVGIGIDLVDLDRFANIIDRRGERFYKKILTLEEISYCLKKVDSIPSMAARFAAKEALIKALPQDRQRNFNFLEMSVLPDSEGRPIATFGGKLREKMKNTIVWISLTHSKSAASAVVVLEKKELD